MLDSPVLKKNSNVKLTHIIYLETGIKALLLISVEVEEVPTYSLFYIFDGGTAAHTSKELSSHFYDR